MNILVIGNGFDLAHGLNTQYKDFLEIVNLFDNMKNIDYNTQIDNFIKNIKGKTIEKKFKEYLIYKLTSGEIRDETKMFLNIKNSNFWLLYFNMLIESELEKKDSWIDFETEIKRVVKKIDKAIKNKGMNINNNNFGEISDSAIITAINMRKVKVINSYKDIIEILEKDLKTLIRCLEIYFEKFVNDCVFASVSPDILNLDFDKVLSFNYTKTFELVYDSDRTIEYDYIHGKADINNTINTNNMVLGIDEYLPKKRRNKETEFIAFKKYYQRIYKGTGCEYKNWIYKIRESGKSIEEKLRAEYLVQIPYIKFTYNMRHNLYIFGHSLDVTDKDILRELILNDNVYTTIYYHKTYDDNGKDDNGRIDLGAKIANLIKIIGQEELIRRTGGGTKTIEFKLQHDMVERV